jgi:DNA-binding beta-propeller fold protein YncE
MNLGQTRVRLVEAGAVFAAVALVAGCGSVYRPVVTPINPSGPAAQPYSLAVVVSAPSSTTDGIATIIDYSGDTVMAWAPIGLNPASFTVNAAGTIGYTVNSDGTITNFPVSSTLQEKNVTVSTIPATAQPVSLFSPASGTLWSADLYGNNVDILTGNPETFQYQVQVAPTPVAVVGPSTFVQRNYSISLNNSNTATPDIISYQDMTCNTAPSTVSQLGEADAIQNSPYTVSATISVGKCPVYAVQSPDNNRVFVLNRGSDTITVINSQINTPDFCTPFTDPNTGRTVTCHPSLPLSTTAGLAQDANNDVPVTAGPVYAEYNAATHQLVVADYDGGTISIIDVSLDEYGNDSATFGTTYTVKVDQNPSVAPYPASVTVLYDGTRAYTANQGDGTVAIVNLSSHTVEKWLTVVGHPRTVVSTENSLYGKVYVASPDTNLLTIIRTDQDIVDTTIPVQGNIVDVRVSTQNGATGNSNMMSRNPGAGQPCYLPPSLEPAPTGTQTAFQVCQTLP